jgi:hypothetical protein
MGNAAQTDKGKLATGQNGCAKLARMTQLIDRSEKSATRQQVLAVNDLSGNTKS